MKPLDGIRVLDLSRVLAGPYCTMMLADMGAEVVKIETPGSGDDTRQWGPPFVQGESAYFLSLNRGKRSLTLNLKSAAGKRILERLIDRSDILVENFRPGTLDRLGFSYEVVSHRNPRMVYCSISGFGQTGPLASRPGYDLILQGEGGLMSLTGFPDREPTKVGVAIADIVAGMFACQGILLALYARERTGEGQRVDIGLLDGQVAILTFQAGIYFMTGRVPGRRGNEHPMIAPYETYRARDGYFNLAVGNDSLWQTFCQTVGLSDLLQDSRFASVSSRVENRPALNAILGKIFAEKTVAEWLQTLTKAGIPCGPIHTLADVLTHPQTLARGMVVERPHPLLGSLKLTGTPVKLSATPGAVTTAPPLLGQHTEEVLRELGYSAADVETFRKAGAV